MTKTVMLQPTYCCRCEAPIFPDMRKVFFSKPYPASTEEATKQLAEGSIVFASHWTRKPIMDRHGNVFDFDPDPVLDHVIAWDGKTFGHDGYCGPCHVELDELTREQEKSFRDKMAIEDAKRRRMWHGMSRLNRAITLMRNEHIRKWYGRQRAEGQLSYWWMLDRSMPGSQAQAQEGQHRRAMEAAE